MSVGKGGLSIQHHGSGLSSSNIVCGVVEPRQDAEAAQPKADKAYDDVSPYDSAKGLTSRRFPGPVFHYTNQAGFLGILREKAIWASDLRYLNDSREYQLGFNLIAQQLQKMTAGQPALEEVIRQQFTVTRVEYAAGVGVASSSLEEDDLNQWRAYAGGSGGICIGFDQDLLADRILVTGGLLGEVRYTAAEQSHIVNSVCTDIVADAKRVVSGTTHLVAFDLRCSLTLQLACALMKHHKFAPEREWRIIVRESLPPTVRSGRATRQGPPSFRISACV
jgi:hypothetical protein